jgi:acylphosphatase
MDIESNFQVTGRVQGVMFRQTFIRAAEKSGLKGAASNMPDGSVCCLLSGDSDKIEEIHQRLSSGMKLNSWGATVEELTILSPDQTLPFQQHQVTTSNVDSFGWSSGVEMYL